MAPERWRKVDQLYHSALEVEQSRRAAFIEHACNGDESLKQEVESLLAQAETGDTFLEAAAVEVAAKALATAGPTPAISTIGRYRVIRLLGEGGMGAVYEAEQDQPRRTVALKIIKPGFATPETLRRFQHESQALGRLQHPGIAQIYEASTADTGLGPQPYFAMELIRGLPLHEYAAQHRLTARDRLALLAKVCDAVDHAHQRGVIHRDLKPGNILVDEGGQPKILDFGVARVTESDAQHTRQTGLGQLVGTLAYMSPEQVAGDPAALDIRSDVYALGVILYELLAGKQPYDISRKPLPEAVGVIREEEPPPLSSINRGYRGDIDTIVAKALEKDKARRYASAAELAGDIRRHLADEPITARPASATYQLQKFARRHKALVAGTTAVFVVLAAGVVASTWEAIRAREAERAAASEAATAQAIDSFLQNDLLAQASAYNSGPATKPDHDLKVRTALDRAAERITGKFDRQPQVEAAIRDTIGQTYMGLGLYPAARKHLEAALNLHRRLEGAESLKSLKTMSQLGDLASLQGRYAEAEPLISRTLDLQRRVLGSEHANTLHSMASLADIYRKEGKFPQAEALQTQTLEIMRRVLGPDDPDSLNSMNKLANLYSSQGKHAQAEALYRQTLEARRRVLGPEHPETLNTMLNLANAWYFQSKYVQAEALYSQTLEIQRRVLAPDHPDTLGTMNNLAAIYYSDSQYAQAERLYRQVMESKRRILGPEHPFTLGAMNSLAEIYSAQGKYAEAEALYRQTLELRRRSLGSEHPDTLDSESDLAFLYLRLGRNALAETYAAKALSGTRHALGSEHPNTMGAAGDLALVYLSEGKFAESEPLAREAVAFDRSKRPDDWPRFRDECLLGASLAGRKRYADAEPLLLGGYRGMRSRKSPSPDWNSYHQHRAREWLAQLYEAWGKPEKAAEWKQK